MPTFSAVMLSISLLIFQFSGLHLHVNSEGNGGLHGTHIHDVNPDPDGHEHVGDTDISIFELGNSFGKLLVFLVPIVFILLVVSRCSQRLWIPVNLVPLPRSRFRWRPPLRAPPVTVS